MMGKNLVIVESPGKIDKIQEFLGKDYIVAASRGHIRDLAEKDLSVDVKKNFEPKYVIPADKKAVVSNLKKLASSASAVYLASDESAMVTGSNLTIDGGTCISNEAGAAYDEEGSYPNIVIPE